MKSRNLPETFAQQRKTQFLWPCQPGSWLLTFSTATADHLNFSLPSLNDFFQSLIRTQSNFLSTAFSCSCKAVAIFFITGWKKLDGNLQKERCKFSFGVLQLSSVVFRQWHFKLTTVAMGTLVIPFKVFKTQTVLIELVLPHSFLRKNSNVAPPHVTC